VWPRIRIISLLGPNLSTRNHTKGVKMPISAPWRLPARDIWVNFLFDGQKKAVNPKKTLPPT
jgi:hypothetical protein